MKQRRKLYDAEDSAVGYEGFYATPEAAQGVVDRMLRTAWWRVRSSVRYVRVVYPGFAMSGYMQDDDTHGTITFHAARLCETSLMHEMTHALVGVTKGTDPQAHERDHGARFAGALLAVYRRFLSARLADLLQEEFDRVGVRWTEYA